MAHPRRTEEKRFCKFCGKQLERKRFGNNRLEDYGAFMRRPYCDRECMRKGMLSKSQNQTYRGSHSTARTTAILFFPILNVCSVCGKRGKMDIHHIDGNYQNNEPNNLAVLCRSCHMIIHARARRKQEVTNAER